MGSSVTRQLIRSGWSVAILDDLSSGFEANLPHNSQYLAFQHGSINIRRDVRNALRGIHWVIHLAARAFVPDSFSRPYEVDHVNVEGSRVLLEECERARIKRLVVASSAEVYGVCEPGVAVEEDTKVDPVSPYGESKLAMEQLVHKAQASGRMETVILRLFNSYGPRATNPYVIPEIVRQYVHVPVVKLGDVLAKRDFCAVDDTAMGIELALRAATAAGETINLGTGLATSVRDVARTIERVSGIEREIVLDPRRIRKRDIPELVADCEKAKTLLGWTASTAFEDGLRKTLTRYREAGSRWPYERDL